MLTRLFLLLGLVSGCSTNCQQLCENMEEFAKNECKINVPDSQLNDCITAFEDPSEAEEDACETFQNIDAEEGWTCELVEKYFTDDEEAAE